MQNLKSIILPGFSKYILYENGDLFSDYVGQYKTWSVTKDNLSTGRKGGYKYCACVDDSGNSITVYQHRVLAENFLKKPENSHCLTVNHIDGNKGNNLLINLEWCTYQENNQHAWDTGLHDNPKKHILVKNLVTGIVTKFKSAKEYSRVCGDIHCHYISMRLKNSQSSKVWADLLQFKKATDKSQWPEVDLSVVDTMPKMNNSFVAKNAITGEITVFTDVVMGSDVLKVPVGTILDHARNNKIIPYNGYNFRYMAFYKRFPGFTDKHKLCISAQLGKNNSSIEGGVDCIDTHTGEEIFYPSIRHCMESLNIKYDHVRTLFFNGRLFKKRYKITLYELRKNLGQPIE